MEYQSNCVDAEFWERIRRARAMTPEERVTEGFRLFDVECEAIRSEIRKHYPGADECEVERRLGDEIRAQREAEERDIYFPVNFVHWIEPD